MRQIILTHLNGSLFSRALKSGIYKLIKAQETLNSINVFPVADADTGTNLCLSMSPLIGVIDSKKNHQLSILLAQLADTLLDNSRGNSGSILAQFFQGLSEYSNDKNELTPFEFALSLELGNKYASDALSNPVEGTIITVIDSFAKNYYKNSIENNHDDFNTINNIVINDLNEAVKETKNQLAVLKKSNVEDAGARGFFILMKGFFDYLLTNKMESKPTQNIISNTDWENQIGAESEQSNYQFCTECIINGTNIDRRKLRESLSKHGDSIVLAGTKQKAKIHIHTNSPNSIFNLSKDFGTVSSEKADDMFAQQKTGSNTTNKFAVITDSAADINEDDIENLNIHIVPVRIQFGEKGYLDKVSITSEDFFIKLKENPIYPTTSQPSIGDFRRQFQYLANHFPDVNSINISNKVSGTFDAAKLATKKITASGQVHIFNSLNASLAQGQITVIAARCAKAGKTVKETLEILEIARSNTKTYAIIPNLKYAVRGGRLPNSVKLIADFLRLTPIVQSDQKGQLKTKSFLFGKSNTLEKFAKLIKNKHKKSKDLSLSIGHALAHDEAKLLKNFLLKDLPEITECKITEIGSGIGVHVGPGAIVVGVQCQSEIKF